MDIRTVWSERTTGQKAAVLAGSVLTLFVLAAIMLAILSSARFSPNAGPSQQLSRERADFQVHSGARSPQAIDAAGSSADPATGKLEVQEGSMRVSSEAARNDAAAFRRITSGHNGYIASADRSTTDTRRRIHMTARVPSNRFDSFTDQLKQRYEADSLTVENYRISVQRQQDEIAVLTEALSDYQDLTERAKQTELDTEQIDILKELTQTQLNTVEELRRYQRQLAKQQDRSNRATFTATFSETLPADVWPDSISNTFREQLSDATETATMALITTVTGAIVVLARVVQFIVYALIVIIPVYAVYRGLRYLYKHVSGGSADQ
jgi:hypothetical protein